MEKPSLDEVLRYSKPLVAKFIGQFAADSPVEQKEEIHQTAALRLIEAYSFIDPEQGWKSFVYNHSRGAVLDYLKFGTGFAEERWSISKVEEHGSRNSHKIRTRESLCGAGSDSNDIDIDHVLGANGVFNPSSVGSMKINWDLVSRLASTDEALLAFAKWLRGFSIDEIGLVLGLSRARTGQLIVDFVKRFDDPSRAIDPEFCQVIWALGLADRLGVRDCDQSIIYGYSIGWKRNAVDLDSSEMKYKNDQIEMFL